MGEKTTVQTTTVPVAQPPAFMTAGKALFQRKCMCGESVGAGDKCEDCKKKEGLLQRRSFGGTEPPAVPPIVHEVLRSSGQPLDRASRKFFEPRFGHDFSKVRIHADDKAATSARAVNALAYAVGHDLVFGAGHFSPTTKAGQRLLAHELTHVLQQRQANRLAVQRKLHVGPANDTLEQEADRFADVVTDDSRIAFGMPIPPQSGDSNTQLQRAVADPAADPSQVAASGAPIAASLLVEDDATILAPGQMRKSEFLEELRASACHTAESVLSRMGRTAQGCPLIERWIARLSNRTSQYVERSIRKYAPESKNARTAQDYFVTVGERVREGVSRWAATGEISGVPSELASEFTGGGILGGLVSGIGGAISGLVSGLGNVASGIGRLFTKARPGGTAQGGNPAAIRGRLGTGVALEGGVKARLETAFGHSFSHVRVHADSRAADLSAGLNARAFTIGGDVAFATGEYRPGTLIGDALIAHELAHVVQQAGASSVPQANGGTEYALEEDADVSAMRAVVSMWQGAKGKLTALQENAVPRLRSGLRLQRCGTTKTAKKEPSTALQEPGAPAAQGGTTPCATSVKIKSVKQFNHSNLANDTDKEKYPTYLGVTSLMEVGPGPDHTGHCMEEHLTPVKNDCDPLVYSRGSEESMPCSRHKCLGINQYRRAMGDGRTHSSFTDGPTTFVDLHRTFFTKNLLEGSKQKSCTVVCEQTYSCDGKLASGKFLITRNYKADTFTNADGTKQPITTGVVTKTEAP